MSLQLLSMDDLKGGQTSVVAPLKFDATLSGVLDLFHIENFSNPSEEEIVFLFSLYSDLCSAAKKLARELDGKADRAYQAVLVTLCKENDITQQPAELQGADPDAMIKSLTSMNCVVGRSEVIETQRRIKLRSTLMDFIFEHSVEEAREILASFKCERLKQAVRLSSTDFNSLLATLEKGKSNG